MGNRAAACWNVFFDGVVGLDQQSSDKKRWNSPFPLFLTETKRSCPEILLIEQQIFGKGFKIDRRGGELLRRRRYGLGRRVFVRCRCFCRRLRVHRNRSCCQRYKKQSPPDELHHSPVAFARRWAALIEGVWPRSVEIFPKATRKKNKKNRALSGNTIGKGRFIDPTIK